MKLSQDEIIAHYMSSFQPFSRLTMSRINSTTVSTVQRFKNSGMSTVYVELFWKDMLHISFDFSSFIS